MLPGMFNPAAPAGATTPEIINAVAANAGSFVSAHPSDYSGGMVTWNSTQTFSSTPTDRTISGRVFRDGDTDNSLFTVGSAAEGFGEPFTTALAWQSSRSSTPPLDYRINGVSATQVAVDMYTSPSIYSQSYRLFKRPVQISASSTSVQADFQTGAATTFANDKGGFIVLPGEWEVASTGSRLSSSGTLSIPPGQIVFVQCAGAADNYVNLLGYGSNSNLKFILNYSVTWYDNLQVSFIGNPTSSTQGISYSINGDAFENPVPVFFKRSGD